MTLDNTRREPRRWSLGECLLLAAAVALIGLLTTTIYTALRVRQYAELRPLIRGLCESTMADNTELRRQLAACEGAGLRDER